MDTRAERVGHNQAVFRNVNERLETLNDALATFTEKFDVVCECGEVECAKQISMTRESYERVRSDPALFVVVPDHEAADVEEVVESSRDYEVVRKRSGDPELTAAETDPRT